MVIVIRPLCRIVMVALAVSLLVPTFPAFAEGSGELKGKLLTALASVTKGRCPEEMMAPMLLDACEQQLKQMQRRLSELGPAKEAKFRGLEKLPTGIEAEVYRVTFAKGSQLWLLYAGADGKLAGLWTPGS